MHLDQIEIHNAVTEFSERFQGWELPRYPQAVRHALNARGRWIAAKTSGVEVRFVAGGPDVQVTLTNPGEAAKVTVRYGSFWHGELKLGAGETRAFLLSRPTGFATVQPDALHSAGWAPGVWRLQMEGDNLVLLDVDPLGQTLRPPNADEKPALRWLAYGSSITNADLLGYPHIAAMTLNVDVLNKGMSGSCHIEPEAVRWLAGLEFDFATLELGVNMRGIFEPDVFEARVRDLLTELRARKPNTPLVLITHFLNRDHHPLGEPGIGARHQLAYDAILRRIHAESTDPNMHLVEGTDILDNFGMLAADMIHPTHEGHARMGQNLAARLKAILKL